MGHERFCSVKGSKNEIFGLAGKFHCTLGGGTLGTGTWVYDTSTQIGHFRANKTQNYSF